MMDYKRDRVWTLIVECHFNQNNECNILPFQVDVVGISYRSYFGVHCRIVNSTHQIFSAWTSMMTISLVQEDSCHSSLTVLDKKAVLSFLSQSKLCERKLRRCEKQNKIKEYKQLCSRNWKTILFHLVILSIFWLNCN